MNNRHFFNLTAWGYDFITDQALWRAQIERGLSFIDDSAPDRVLDLGCGPGISAFVLARQLPQAAVLGIDLSDQMIARARRHHHRRHPDLENLSFQRADIYDLPFDEPDFDLAVGHSFLYLLPQRRRALTAIREVLRPGGRLVLMEPNARGSLVEAGLRAPVKRLRAMPSDALRFATSMVLWRLVSGRRGRLQPAALCRLFERAEFADITVAPTLQGLGIHATGKRRAASNLDPTRITPS